MLFKYAILFASFIFYCHTNCWFLCLVVTQIIRESQASKVVSAKFQRNTQTKYATSTSKSQESNISLMEVLSRSSNHTKCCVKNAGVQQNESIFEAFKLTKKSIKTGKEFDVWCEMMVFICSKQRFLFIKEISICNAFGFCWPVPSVDTRVMQQQ